MIFLAELLETIRMLVGMIQTAMSVVRWYRGDGKEMLAAFQMVAGTGS